MYLIGVGGHKEAIGKLTGQRMSHASNYMFTESRSYVGIVMDSRHKLHIDAFIADVTAHDFQVVCQLV